MKNAKPNIAYDYILAKILSGAFSPGQPLRTELLAKQIGVSRTPVTEALLQLQSTGLVSIRSRLGASVRQMGVKEFLEICDVRLALESQAAHLAALHSDESDRHKIERTITAMRKLTDEVIAKNEPLSIRAELAKEDVLFHVAIISAAKNSLLKREILRLHLINRLVAGLPHNNPEADARKKEATAQDRRATLVGHEEIFAAIMQRDAPAAKLAMERHIQNIIDGSLSRLSQPKEDPSKTELTTEESAYSVSV